MPVLSKERRIDSVSVVVTGLQFRNASTRHDLLRGIQVSLRTLRIVDLVHLDTRRHLRGLAGLAIGDFVLHASRDFALHRQQS